MYSVSLLQITLCIYALGGPTLLLAETQAERNILGLINKVGIEAGKKVIKLRSLAQNIIQTLGGKKIHQVTSLPGGVSRGLAEDERDVFAKDLEYFIEFGKFTFDVFDNIVLKNPEYIDLILSDVFTQKTYYMGLVDENNKVNFYDGKVRVVDPEGN
jgi:F420-non-reducing hydrogenase large subunit